MTETYVYEDELNDDFADNFTQPLRIIDENYKYNTRNPLWHIISFVLYYLLAVPFGFLYIKIAFGLKIKGRKNLRKLKGGYCLYLNHTNWIDSFIPSFIAWPKRAYIITSPRAVSLPLLPILVPMLGGVPLNSSSLGKKHFREFLNKKMSNSNVVAVFPEAHLWPFYNKIRNFNEHSFTYPVRQKTPVVISTLTYHQRRVFKNAKPTVTITIGRPILPDTWEKSDNPKMFLRNKVLKIMKDTVRQENSYAFNKYIKKS